MEKKLLGTKISLDIQEELKKEIQNLHQKKIYPSLSVILVGNDPASTVYVKKKQEMCEKLGIISKEYKLNKNIEPHVLFDLIETLNKDKTVSGILCQSPLPSQFHEAEVFQKISVEKDVDCFHPYNFGLLAAGNPVFMPCTPFGVLHILKRSQFELKGKEVVVLGRSNIVGRPLSILMSLKGMDATVTICHSKTNNLQEVCQRADILIAAIGKPKFVTKEYVKQGAIVIDVGINRIDAPNTSKGFKLIGDVDFEAVEPIVKAITPVPGGVGPMTISMLMYNTINATRFQNKLTRFEL